MKGTEKQISYAEDLIKKMNSKFDELLSECPEDKKEMWEGIVNKYNSIMSDAYAGDVINLLKSANTEENYQKWYSKLYSRMLPNSDSLSRRIKKEVYGR